MKDRWAESRSMSSATRPAKCSSTASPSRRFRSSRPACTPRWQFPSQSRRRAVPELARPAVQETIAVGQAEGRADLLAEAARKDAALLETAQHVARLVPPFGGLGWFSSQDPNRDVGERLL